MTDQIDNTERLKHIDELLDDIDEQILNMDLPKYMKRRLSVQVYALYNKLEQAVDDFTPMQ